MPSQTHNVPIRQADAQCPDGCVTATDIRSRLAQLERKQAEMTTAFVLNDLKTPDFDGHRKSHLEMIEAAHILKNYKISATQKVIASAVAIIVLLVSTGLTTKLTELFKGM